MIAEYADRAYHEYAYLRYKMYVLSVSRKDCSVLKSISTVLRSEVCSFGLVGVIALTGCAQKGAVESFADWEHRLQGGVVAGPLLPPPGFDKPYPKVGRVPREIVAMPSLSARDALSEKLIEHRNLAHYLAAQDGTLILPQTPPSPSALPQASQPRATEVASSTMPIAAPDAAPQGGASGETAAANNTSQVAVSRQGQDGLALPQVTRYAPPKLTRRDIPSIPSVPPQAPQFAGFKIPHTQVDIRRDKPRFSLADAPGRLIRFPKMSDQFDAHEAGVINRVAGQYRPGQSVTVTGFGETVSFETPDQIAAMLLAILRAQHVAQALARRGVPPTDIRLQAMPLGQGVRVVFGTF